MSRRIIKHYGVEFRVVTLTQATDDEGVDCCPLCQCRTINLVDEHIQLGLWGRNRYTVFNECDGCQYHFAVDIMRTAEDYYAPKHA